MAQHGSNIYAPRYLVISGTGNAGAQSLVAAVPNFKIRVLGFTIGASGGCNVIFQDGTPINLTGAFVVGNLVSQVNPVTDAGWFVTAAGVALNIIVTNAIVYAGFLVYDLVPA
jgi:hypothetical protein